MSDNNDRFGRGDYKQDRDVDNVLPEGDIFDAFADMSVEELNSVEFDELIRSLEIVASSSENLYHIQDSVDEIRELSLYDTSELDRLIIEVEEGIVDDTE